MLGREEAEELFEEKLYNDDEKGEKKKHWLSKLVIVLVLIAFVAGIVFATVPQARGMLTGEDYVTSTQLKKAVNIETFLLLSLYITVSPKSTRTIATRLNIALRMKQR